MADSGGGSAPVCNFVRKPPKNIRKRPSAPAGSDDENDGGGGAIAVLRSKKQGPSAPGKLVFSSTDGSAAEPRQFYYESSRTIQASTDIRATATLETETEFDRDARAVSERQLKQADQESLKKNPSLCSGAGEVYKGIHGYTDHKAGFRREHTVSGEKAAGGSHGPLRAPAHIRRSAQFDYQPGICKDYKETGYCGYGDSCKFMHDRGDYKSSCQLEKEAEKARELATEVRLKRR